MRFHLTMATREMEGRDTQPTAGAIEDLCTMQADLVSSRKRGELSAPPRNAWRINGAIRRLRLPGLVG